MIDPIYSLLSSSEDLSDLVGSRIFPDEVPEGNTSFPVVIYRNTHALPTNDFDGPSQIDFPRYDVICYAKTRSEANRVGQIIRDVLDGNSVDNVSYIWFVDGFGDFDKPSRLYLSFSEYKLAQHK